MVHPTLISFTALAQSGLKYNHIQGRCHLATIVVKYKSALDRTAVDNPTTLKG